MKKPVILMILDGFGVGLEAEKRGDAIKAAKKPNIDKLLQKILLQKSVLRDLM